MGLTEAPNKKESMIFQWPDRSVFACGYEVYPPAAAAASGAIICCSIASLPPAQEQQQLLLLQLGRDCCRGLGCGTAATTIRSSRWLKLVFRNGREAVAIGYRRVRVKPCAAAFGLLKQMAGVSIFFNILHSAQFFGCYVFKTVSPLCVNVFLFPLFCHFRLRTAVFTLRFALRCVCK